MNGVPHLISQAILVLVTWYALKLTRLLFVSIGRGAIALSGFDAAWTRPTYRLVQVAVIAFTLVAAYTHIPGSESQAFKGVSSLIGGNFSLESTSPIGKRIFECANCTARRAKPGNGRREGAEC